MHAMHDSSFQTEGMASSLQQDWIAAQDLLKNRLVLGDDFTWTLSSQDSTSDESFKTEKLQYIGGVDLSFLKEDPSLACGALVIVDAVTLKVVHEEFDVARLQIPYIPGFLAFREVSIILGLLNKMKRDAHPFYPQLLMVDGNGLLHPRGFGLACHLGVLANLPTIGIGKNLHHVDGLTQSGVRQLLEGRENCEKDLISLIGKSGQVWGAAMRSTPGSSKPIYISIGHRISLDSSIRIVKLCSKFRVPEPVRQADIRSRAFLQKPKGSQHVNGWVCVAQSNDRQVLSSSQFVLGAMAEEVDVIAGLLSEFIKAGELSPNEAASVGSVPKTAKEISPEDAAWVDSCLVADPEMSDDGWIAVKEALLDTVSARATASTDADEMQQERDEVVEAAPVVRHEEQSSSEDQDDGNVGSDVEEEIESLKDIFRVWDLETPDDEEDELIIQLKRALGASRLNDPSAGLKVDELATGMADLSLKSSSSDCP